jgi:hypothetical protein
MSSVFLNFIFAWCSGANDDPWKPRATLRPADTLSYVSNLPPPDPPVPPEPTGEPRVAETPTPDDRQRFSLRDVFLGREGLRAGWALLLYLSLVYALAMLTAPLAHMLRPARTQQPHTAGTPANLTLPSDLILSEGCGLAVVVFATWTMSRLEGRELSAYGTASRCGPRNFLAGLAWGLALLALLVFALRAAGLLAFDSRLLFGLAVPRYAAIWLIGFLLVAVLEEYLMRGYLQFTLTRGLAGIFRRAGAPRADALAFWTAAFLLSIVFSLGHTANAGESPLGLVAAGLVGLLFCLSLWRTGSLWWAIGFHASWDWAQSFLFGVADSGGVAQGRLFASQAVGRPILSGGLTGPEGSLLVLPVLALTWAVIVLTLPPTQPGTHSSHPATPAPSPSLD